jgi:hypothetical protein
MAKSLVANEDQYILSGSILRKYRELNEVAARRFGKEIAIPTQIVNARNATREMRDRWKRDINNGTPLFFDQNEYNAMAMLAQWTVSKWHELHGTPVPDSIREWSVCHQALGATGLKDIGIAD